MSLHSIRSSVAGDLSPDEWQWHIENNVPLVIRGGTAASPALRLWQNDTFLAEELRSLRRVNVESAPDNRFGFEGSTWTHKSMSVGTFIRG